MQHLSTLFMEDMRRHSQVTATTCVTCSLRDGWDRCLTGWDVEILANPQDVQRQCECSLHTIPPGSVGKNSVFHVLDFLTFTTRYASAHMCSTLSNRGCCSGRSLHLVE